MASAMLLQHVKQTSMHSCWMKQQHHPELAALAARVTLPAHTKPGRCRHTVRQHAVESAAAAPQPAADQVVDEDDPEQQLARLPRPSQHHQAQLTGKERASLRSQAEQLAKAKTLQRVQIGSKGVTLNVLLSIMDILMRHEYLRVKLGEGCGLERKQTASQLAQLLDAAVVGQVGFTITLYRQKGLPRPDSLDKPGPA